MDGLIGEAWAGVSPDGCHMNVVLAERGSPTAAAAVGALANPGPGHTPFLVCLGPGNVVRIGVQDRGLRLRQGICHRMECGILRRSCGTGQDQRRVACPQGLIAYGHRSNL